MKRKSFGILLSVCLTLSLLPATALASPSTSVQIGTVTLENGGVYAAASETETNGKLNIPTAHRSTYAVVELTSLAFQDVTNSDWFYGNVQYAVDNNLFNGTSASTFNPHDTMTRGMLVTVLWRMAGKPVVNYAMNFADVAADSYYTEAVRWAASNKIVSGYGDSSFGPNDSITREQMASILYRYAVLKDYDTAQGGMAVREFTDYESVSDYALRPMGWSVNAGLIKGSAGKLLPQDGAQRAQVAAILQRFAQNIVK